MKIKRNKAFYTFLNATMNTVVLIIAIVWCLFPNDFSSSQCSDNRTETADVSDVVPGSCTIFTASYGNTVLFGNNEDWRLPTTFYWVKIPGENTYGGVYLGHRSAEDIRSRGLDDISPQGGVNEKGLAFDYAALPQAPLTPYPKLPAKGHIMMKIQQSCATVEEAIAMAKKHDWGTALRWQVLLADATGAAVIISAGKDRELAFTRKPPGNGYLATTNFNRANLQNTFAGSYPCWRYDKSVELLEKIESEENLTVDYFKSILDAVHVESAIGNTEYSNVIDLKNGIIYLNHWHQYDETATINVAKEIAKHSSALRLVDGIAKQPPPIRIKDLFSPETVRRAEREHQEYKKRDTE
jgi:hypothetical protein